LLEALRQNAVLHGELRDRVLVAHAMALRNGGKVEQAERVLVDSQSAEPFDAAYWALARSRIDGARGNRAAWIERADEGLAPRAQSFNPAHRYLEGQFHVRLAFAHYAAGSPKDAIVHCEKALDAMRECGDELNEGIAIAHLATCYIDTGLRSEAQ